MKPSTRLALSLIWFWMPADSVSAAEFHSIFDGKTLKGWKAKVPRYFSVEDGAITAQSTQENPCTANQFIVWQGGEVADFELKAKFRLSGNKGNSGIQFRSRLNPHGRAIGYQADILPGGAWCGALCDENSGRKTMLAANGQKTVISRAGERTTTNLGTKAKLKPDGEWNDYHISARGNQIILKINGRTTVEVIDRETRFFKAAGILGLQLRSGAPMKVQFKDIYLKRLSASAGG